MTQLTDVLDAVSHPSRRAILLGAWYRPGLPALPIGHSKPLKRATTPVKPGKDYREQS